ncbi:MAG: cysteine methyltransferase [Bacteroidetes bacterium]|nr:MAG: cysteine methyltransferase [Bacteroidota bacterium]
MNNQNIIISGKIQTPLGEMLACVSDKGLSLLEFTNRKKYERQISGLKKYLKIKVIPGNHPFLEQVTKEMNEYFAGKRKTFDIPLFQIGTEFQKRVWEGLLQIPYGKTLSYSGLAKKIGKPKAVRALANANAANKIAIIIPCHRVIGADGTLTGYASGLDKKKFLLDLEIN